MDSDDTRESTFKWGPLADALTEFAASFMEPVYLGDAPLVRRTPKCFNATATLLNLGERFFAVTCSHVLAKYREVAVSESRSHFQIGHLTLRPEQQLLDEDPDLDLAVIEIKPEQLVDCDFPVARTAGGLPRSSFFSPRDWPPEPVTVEDVVSYAGYPGVWREQTGLNHMTFFILSHGASGVHSVGEDYFYSRIELEKCEGQTYDGKEISALGGMSGGPVFSWRKHRLQADLVGFITEYHANFDLLYIRSSRVLRSDGTLEKVRGIV